ncbi:RNA polymerase sigma factor SigJ [Streptomyces sp. NPDC020917]|uniref:RNA polymerase sigma factor SigJ n=1 Tax=Streptomyces sp. NPDC020917 TaxID=3365102 RepID=UPI003796080B
MEHEQQQPLVDDPVLGGRRHLVWLAFRILGTVAEAEDAVQETYTRWYRMSQAERDAIEVPRAWLTRVAGRVCLDMATSARARRERYVGPWLPEPVPTAMLGEAGGGAGDPADRLTLDESVSTALLVVLEAMTPAERVAFVLHDVFAVPYAEIAETVGRTPGACRQLASSARSRVRRSPGRQVTRADHDNVVRAFAAACREGDLVALTAALDPQAVLRSDGGGKASTARKPVHGADRVARFVLGAARARPYVEITEQQTADGLGFVLWEQGRITGVVTLEVAGGLVTAVLMMLNPDKLTLWNP